MKNVILALTSTLIMTSVSLAAPAKVVTLRTSLVLCKPGSNAICAETLVIDKTNNIEYRLPRQVEVKMTETIQNQISSRMKRTSVFRQYVNAVGKVTDQLGQTEIEITNLISTQEAY